MTSARKGPGHRLKLRCKLTVADHTSFIKATRRHWCAWLVLAATLLVVPASVSAQVPPDEAWRTLTTDHFRVTFPQRIEATGRRAADRAERAYAELSAGFVDPPKGRIDILVTDHTDVSNGFAQIRPSNRITVFARPPADDMGLGYFDDWMELVITHELAHVFHLDRTGPLGRLLRGVFGRAESQWPFFPGVSVPRWTTEGLATWYESFFSHAGRVEGTYHEMILRTAALEGRFEDLDEASGDSPVWPGGTRAYAYGSLFFEHLMDKYGDERMGAFAEAVAGQWVPYRLNAAARDAFGNSMSDEWQLWTDDLTARAEALQARSRGDGASVPEPLTHHGRYALYPQVSPDGATVAYAAADGRSEAQIRVLGTGTWNLLRSVRTNSVANFDWTPDGELAFTQFEFEGPYRTFGDLYLTADGGVRRVTRGARLTDVSVAPSGSWSVAVQEGGGTDGLVRVDLTTGAVTALVVPDPDVHWSFPAVSPDGRWIAVSRWTPGAHLDVVVLDLQGRVVLTVTDDRALDLAPAWTADGTTLLWGSDRTGIPNILAAEVDPGAGRVGTVRMVTRVLTGAAYPAVDPAGKFVYFSGYHADGWSVERIPMDPASWPPAPAADPRFDAPPRSVAVQDAAAPGPVTSYSPFPTLLPTYWKPLLEDQVRTGATRTSDGGVIRSRELLGIGMGFETGGRDLVGRHAWGAFARIRTSGDHPDWGASWSYAGLANPIVSLSANQFWNDDGPRLGQKAADGPVDTLFVLERSRSVSASTTFFRPRWRSDLALTLSGGMSWEHRDLLDNALEPSGSYVLGRPDGRFGDLGVALSYATARSYAYQMGGADGFSVLVRARTRAQMALPDSLSGVLGSDGSLDEVLGRLVVFKALGGPGFASHVLALRASGGAARGPGADAGHFDVGGASGDTDHVTRLSLITGSPLFFPVRGYEPSSRYGARAWSASAEYRFPLLSVHQGLGQWPMYMDRIIGAFFADAGNAWGPDAGPHGFVNARRDALASVGGEITADLVGGWIVPARIRVGAAYPLVQGTGTKVYVRLGLSF